MPSHSETQLLPYTTRQLFTLVADIERYPQFLPWCRAARILERNGDVVIGELVIAFSAMTESYTSRVTLTPPADEHAPCAIDVAMVKGPFEHLTNQWRFTPEGEGTRIDFSLDFKFRSRVLEKLMGAFFTKATARMVGAFTERAKALYGVKA